MIDTMLPAKQTRARQLLTALRYGGWDNAEFWETQQLISSTFESDMNADMLRLMSAWSDVEGERIDNGVHEPCGPELEAEIKAKWPIVR